ncbi:MAG TPA: IPT/TIG domain-containing protein, partial [Longimicrobium sp.]|nr:IPT/TIG domain-containing protein [Longimicrobium sp.]
MRSSWRPLAVLALALAAACGDDGPSGPGPNPAPVVAAVSPGTVQAGSAEATLTVTGSRFVAQSTVRLNGADRPTEFVSATELRARLTAADLATAGTAQVTVFSPAPGGGVSGAAELVVANPLPAVASLAPVIAVVGSAGAVVTVTGTGFVPASVVRAGGAARPTTFVSPTVLRVELAAADLAAAGQAELTVFNPAPGGGVSNAAALAVDNPVPAVASLAPGMVLAGSADATVTV